MPQLLITVCGTPAPQGSKRHVGHGVMVESSEALAPWREDVKLAALRALEYAPDWDRDLPEVGVHVVFGFPRPRSHYRTGRHASELRPDAPHLVGKKPDLDKLLRSTGDALTAAGVWADDARMAWVFAAKTFVGPAPGDLDRPGARIVLRSPSFQNGTTHEPTPRHAPPGTPAGPVGPSPGHRPVHW